MNNRILKIGTVDTALQIYRTPFSIDSFKYFSEQLLQQHLFSNLSNLTTHDFFYQSAYEMWKILERLPVQLKISLLLIFAVFKFPYMSNYWYNNDRPKEELL